jgi:hypothetical protein
MRRVKRFLIALIALLGLAFILLNVGPDTDTDADIDASL